MKHTEGKVHVVDGIIWGFKRRICNMLYDVNLGGSVEEKEANAERLVLTWNSHDPMLKVLKKANKMLNHIGCVHGANCDGKGTLNTGDQCQWCDEKKEIESIISQIENK